MRKATLRTCLFILAAAASLLAQKISLSNIDDVLDKGLALRWQDDAIGHPDLIAFREYLKKAAREHDAKAVLEVADSDVRGCDMRGIDDLRKFLTGQWWFAFGRSLTEGGVLSQDGNAFDSNYTVRTFPYLKVGVLGPEYFRVVSDANVPVLERPDPHSRNLASLSYNLVEPEEPLLDTGWQRIKFKRGRSGFIDSKYLIDPIGMSIGMRRLGAKWRLIKIATYCD